MGELQSSLVRLRRKVFVEVARVALYSKDVRGDLEAIPYKITPTQVPRYRESVYRERAIASERVRLAMGMSLNPQDRPAHVTNGLAESNLPEQYYEPPLMQVIPSACDKCEDNVYQVVACRKCVARYCVSVCPTNAVSVKDGSSFAEIAREKCVKCGKCKKACPYEAIIHMIRPCAEACGVNAIKSDGYGRADIKPEICVGCGQCMVRCPFGAIADKSQLFQLLRSLKAGGTFVAEVAPAIVGQFGEGSSLEKIAGALKKLGFSAVYEVASGADASACSEAHTYATEVATGQKPFLLTSCCPSWSMLAKTQFPETVGEISSSLTPMVITAHRIKRERPEARVVFIGPCAAKKLEAMRRSVRSEVDFVITFEELAAVLEAADITVAECEEVALQGATAAGRGYGVAGGVAEAVEACVHEYHPDAEVKIEHAEGLTACKKALLLAKVGKKRGYLIEGMGCPGGCVGGAGVNLPVERGADLVRKFAENTKEKLPNREQSTKY